MTETNRADMAVMAQRTLSHFNDHDRATLARDAKYLADRAARYAKRIAEGGKDMGDANRMAQAALELACIGERLDARLEASSLMDAVVDDAASGPEEA